MKYLVGLVLVGCSVGIVAIQGFGDPAGWATAVPADLPKLGLALIAVVASTVGGMVFSLGGTSSPPLPPEATPSKPTRKREAISEPLSVLSMDEDEEAARRRARRAKRRKAKAKALAESGEAAPKRKKKKRATADTGDEPRRRKRTRKTGSSSEISPKRARKRELVASGRH